jgi:hypothetical protein
MTTESRNRSNPLQAFVRANKAIETQSHNLDEVYRKLLSKDQEAAKPSVKQKQSLTKRVA